MKNIFQQKNKQSLKNTLAYVNRIVTTADLPICKCKRSNTSPEFSLKESTISYIYYLEHILKRQRKYGIINHQGISDFKPVTTKFKQFSNNLELSIEGCHPFIYPMLRQYNSCQ